MTFLKHFALFLSISSCQASTWFAADIERTTFIKYIENYVQVGDTIYFPADTAVWNMPYTIKKGVILIGAGMDKTCITSNYISNSPLIRYDPANYSLNSPFRFSGITLDCAGKSRGLFLGKGNMPLPYQIQTKIRIDHNRFKGPKAGQTAQFIWHFSMYGVVDNNVFESCKYPIKADTGTDCSWWEHENFDPGTEDNCLYFEDNIFLGVGDLITDCQFSGRYVYRYNDITVTANLYPLFDMHGNQTGTAGMCACFGGEIYGNNIAGNYDITFLDHRGGQAFVFYNNFVSKKQVSIQVREEYPDSGNPPPFSPDGQPQHISESYYWNNRVNYTGTLFDIFKETQVGDVPRANRDYFTDARIGGNIFDGTSGVGSGTLANRPTTCTTGVGYWVTDQSVTDLSGKVGVNPDSALMGILYRATATNTWAEYYTPLPYPHPLRSPDPPKNLHFKK